jgi:tetratricopeptide (TPR) repeat protein
LQFALASLYLKTEQADKAEKLLSDVIDKHGVELDGLKARAAIAAMKFQAGDLPAATSYIEEVLEENPKDNAALLLKGRIAIKDKNYTEAVTALRSVLKDLPDSVEVFTLLATAYQASGEHELAEESLRQAVDAKQGDVDARMRLAAYLAGNDDYDGAMEQIDTALVAEPDSVKALRAKAELLSRLGNADELETVLTHLQEVSPETGVGAFGKGRLYKSQQKYPESLAAYEEALASEPQSVLVLTEIVAVEVQMGNPDAAITRLNQVLVENPDHQAAHFLLGSVYMKKKEYAKAEEQYSKQLTITPESSQVYKMLALSRNSQGNFEGAVNILQQGLEQLPGDSALLQALANLYVRKNDLDKAATVYEDAVKAAPDDLMLALGLASVRERQGRYEDAITVYEQQITSHPDNVIVVNNLAALLADHRTDEASLRKAKEISGMLAASTQPALLDTLGWVHYRLGEYDQAVEVLSGVVEKAPDVPVFRYHLGMAYYKQGDNSAAKNILSEAVAEDMTYDGVEEARRVYKEIGGE